MAACEYPHGYVDPYPRFFAAVEAIARKGAAAVRAAPFETPRTPAMERYFATLEKTVARLRAIAERERNDEPLTKDDIAFLNEMVAIESTPVGCTEERVPTGWHADLYFEREKILSHELVVADVHTQPTDEVGTMVGRVLHVGTGMPRAMTITIAHDGGKHTQTYRGVVATYGKEITSGFKRYTDEAWRKLYGSRPPPAPSWMGQR